MRIVRLDSVGGASGDMILAALAAIGADLDRVATDLNAIFPENIRFFCEPAAGHGLRGSRVGVRAGHATAAPRPDHWPDAGAPAHAHAAHDHAKSPGNTVGMEHPGRTLRDIEALLDNPALPARPRRLALAAFRRLAVAEADIHGKTKETVHFHEVGALDSIADVAGACLALEQLDAGALILGPLPCGVGTIACAHGVMPNPAPATLLLLDGLEVVPTDEPFELVTPTAAALLAAWRAELAPFAGPAHVLRTGFGFGSRTLLHRPNVLRATLLEAAPHDLPGSDAGDGDALCVLETNLDDCSPQWIGDLISRLLAAGARDAWAVHVTMKKGRPGFIVAALAARRDLASLQDLIFRASTSFGIRSHPVSRVTLDRRFETVDTPWGQVRVKIGSSGGQDLIRTPEFEDCARLAMAAGVLPRQVHEAALRAH